MKWKTALFALCLAACGGDDETAPTAAADTTRYADPMPIQDIGLSAEELARGRLDTDWTEVVTLDSTGAGAPVQNLERWEQISPRQVNTGPAVLPLAGNVEGPSVLRVQILLDRAYFSPGVMDGYWGKNTAKAVYFFQQREGLRTTGRVETVTFERLAQVAGAPEALIRPHRLSADDVAGPFVQLPDSIYDIARLDCTCYESLGEKLSERFHVSREILEKLNPDIRLDAVRAGQTLQVPAVRDSTARPGVRIARLVVSGQGSYLHALDAQGRIVYHFPSTLGATYDPSPQGSFEVRRITRDPTWHYQPQLLARVPDDRPEAMIPAGPNNAVGVVWMALSAPHYGIHGTPAPEAIGYTSSAGCVRLTNWDAQLLASALRPGTPVRFRDISGRTAGGGRTGERPPAAPAAGRPAPAPDRAKRADPDNAPRRSPAILPGRTRPDSSGDTAAATDTGTPRR